MKKLIALAILAACAAAAHAGVVTGDLDSPSGLPIKNGTLTFNLQQAGLIEGTGSVVPLSVNCYTSMDGSVVGLPNPLSNVASSINYGSGTLPSGTYYIELTFYSSSQETLPSPELRIQLTGAGTLIISPPASFPPNAAGMRVYIGTESGAETLQGQTTSQTEQYSQSTPISSGSTVPSINSSACSIAFNDTIIPYSGYNVSLTSSNGNAYPGWPQAWQLNGGLSGTVNISNGTPLWNGTIVYPQPIVAQPLNHGPQSISGSLNLSGYNLVGAGTFGVGTNTPSWPVDVENGPINSSGGYLYGGGAGTIGQCLVSNGTAFVPGACYNPGSLYYQALSTNGTNEPQEPIADFGSAFSLSDNAGRWTAINLAPTNVTAGSYTNAAITVNAAGQVTAASNGAALPTVQSLVVTSGICTTPDTAGATCSMASVLWPAAFADANYAVTCTPGVPTPSPASINLYISGKTTTYFTITLQVGQGSSTQAATLPEIDCIGVHP